MLLLPLLLINSVPVMTGLQANIVRFEWINKGGLVQQHAIKTVPGLTGLDQEDPTLVDVVKQLFLLPPPPLAGDLKLHDTALEGDGQATMLDQTYFHERKKGGFFVEAGAYNGWTGSNSLHFEAAHQWSGLLVEPVPQEYAQIAQTGRRVWSSPTCLATTATAKMVPVSIDRKTMNSVVEPGSNSHSVVVQCLPLYSLLLALGNPTVDFLSLDTEGGELEVLETLPWDKVDIRAISVETQHQTADTRERLLSLLLAVGFTHLGSLARDDVFVKLQAGGLSPLQTVREVMSRRTRRLCHFLRVPLARLAGHCATNWPRDWYRDQTYSEIQQDLLIRTNYSLTRT